MVFGRRQVSGCAKFRPMLSSHIDGRLDDKDAEALRQHLAGCTACLEELSALEQTVQALKLLPRVPVPRPFLIEDVRGARPSPWFVYFRNASAAISAMLVVVLAFGYLQQPARQAMPLAATVQRAASLDKAVESGTVSDAAGGARAGHESESAMQPKTAAPTAPAAPPAAAAAPAPTAAVAGPSAAAAPALTAATAPPAAAAAPAAPTAGTANTEFSASQSLTEKARPAAAPQSANAATRDGALPPAPASSSVDNPEDVSTWWLQPLEGLLAGLLLLLITATLICRPKSPHRNLRP